MYTAYCMLNRALINIGFQLLLNQIHTPVIAMCSGINLV